MNTSVFTKRSIADQTGELDFQFRVTPSNTTGTCEFGLSGDSVFSFLMESGRLYADSGEFVYSYVPGSQLFVSGQLAPRSYDFHANGRLIGVNCPTSGDLYSWIFVKPEGVTVDFDCVIKGEMPDYSLDASGEYTGAGGIISGKIVNNSSRLFRIFDLDIPATSDYYLTGFTNTDITDTGYFLLTTNETGISDREIPLLFHTNFGDLSVSFKALGNI